MTMVLHRLVCCISECSFMRCADELYYLNENSCLYRGFFERYQGNLVSFKFLISKRILNNSAKFLFDVYLKLLRQRILFNLDFEGPNNVNDF